MFGLTRLSPEGKVGVATGVVFFSMLISRTLVSDRVSIETRAILFRVQFLLFINSLLLLGSLYIWKRLVRRLCTARAVARVWPQRCWRGTVLLFLALAHGSYVSMFWLVDTEPHWFAMLSFTCLGIYVILIFFLMATSCLNRIHRLFSHRSDSQDGFGSGAVRQTLLALLVTALLTVYGLFNAARPPQVVDVEIPLEKLPVSMNGLKLVLLSDIHLGPTVGRSKLQLIVNMVNQLEPDVVVIVGDLTDSKITRLRTAAEPLGLIRARLGSYFVTGNHDYYTADVEGWFEFLHSKGIKPLHNTHVRVFPPEHSQDWICLAGIDDLEASMLREANEAFGALDLVWVLGDMYVDRPFLGRFTIIPGCIQACSLLGYPGHGMDIEKALSGCSKEYPIILLAHQPYAAKMALKQNPDINLILSGHTHAGQIFPFTLLAFLVNPYFCGLYHVSDHTSVYVTQGTGYYGIPMRIGSQAEITKIILKSI